MSSRRSAALAAALAMVGAALFGLTAQARAEVLANVRVPFSGTTTNPCFPDGGEEVAFDGISHLVYREQQRDEPVDTTLNFTEFKGVGLTSGDRYTMTGTSTIHHNVTQGATSENIIATLGLMSQGSGDNFRFSGYFHVTYNAVGEITAYRFNSFGSDCVG